MADATDTEHELSPLAGQLAQGFRLSDGVLRLPEAELARWSERCGALDDDARERLLPELLGLAVLLQREHGDGAGAALDQLGLLAQVVIGELAAGDAIEQDADARGAQAAVTGAAPSSKRPVGSGERPAGALNPMALRLGQGTGSKRRR